MGRLNFLSSNRAQKDAISECPLRTACSELGLHVSCCQDPQSVRIFVSSPASDVNQLVLDQVSSNYGKLERIDGAVAAFREQPLLSARICASDSR